MISSKVNARPIEGLVKNIFKKMYKYEFHTQDIYLLVNTQRFFFHKNYNFDFLKGTLKVSTRHSNQDGKKLFFTVVEKDGVLISLVNCAEQAVNSRKNSQVFLTFEIILLNILRILGSA